VNDPLTGTLVMSVFSRSHAESSKGGTVVTGVVVASGLWDMTGAVSEVQGFLTAYLASSAGHLA
jgi:hypothetical protein